jgi:enhancer of polycomb-like protein
MLVDRRHAVTRPIMPTRRSALIPLESSDDDMVVDQEEAEGNKRIMERWKFDTDDVPAVGPEGPDEQDRVLVDDYDSK